MKVEFAAFASWHDPQLDRDLADYDSAINDLRERKFSDQLLAAANLCETSRAILYRLPRINKEQAESAAAAFARAVDAITELKFTNSDDQVDATNFANHIQRRINNLLGTSAVKK